MILVAGQFIYGQVHHMASSSSDDHGHKRDSIAMGGMAQGYNVGDERGVSGAKMNGSHGDRQHDYEMDDNISSSLIKKPY